jgi:putative aldouronate transport system permease protein
MAMSPLQPRRGRGLRLLLRERELWLLSLPFFSWVAVFAYFPMYGLSISFLAYVPGKPIIGSAWVGLKYFIEFLTSPDFGYVMRNTLVISALGILVGFPAPVALALLLTELRGRLFKRTIQTVSYLPHFISWVVTASLIFTLLGNEGVVNDILVRTGLVSKPVNFLGTGRYFWWLITFANIWKGIGWSSIIYLSAIAGIDPELYQAGAVDGLGRFGMIRHITLPGISTTIVLLLLLEIGAILNAGFEQQLLLGNPQTRLYYEVIDTYAYKYGVQMGRYPYATAVGFMQSIVGLILVFSANWLSRKALDISVV